MFSAKPDEIKRWLLAAVVMLWCGSCLAEPMNIRPLAFGMTPAEASLVLRGPLLYVRGPPGSEVYVFERRADVPGIYPVADRVFLQFRRGRLTGWKRDWHIPRSSIW
jgi:hypothetical protein